ncbi:MAG: VWA domain-containing protein [Treponema sp.]|nr:VWA domain-containing protein [Treponema sp.]MBR4630342.1 VWA domain-containing protein [Treponema sp.]MBR6912927.1 VWA domain-containing protein [Treponema sp.]MCR5126118.1 VWA domain-containing protein [Treponema sp.]
MKKIFLTFWLFALGLSAFSNDSLLIRGDDLRLVYVADDAEDSSKSASSGASLNDDFDEISGFHLYIRKKEGIESVLLCDTTKDPDGKNDNYSYRALEYNSVNGDEVTYLNGKPLVSEYAKYRLADSTPEPDEEFGEAFHIYIPMEMTYGYPWSRNGKINVKRGTFVNIRAFSKKYADYDGEFADNPFMFDLQIPEGSTDFVPILTDNYSPEAAASFSDIAEFSGGKMVISNLDKLSDDVMDSIERISGNEVVDIVFAIDTTGSMKDDVKVLRDQWVPKLMEMLNGDGKTRGSVRLGLLLYRDYEDDYEYKKLPVKFFDFTDDVETFKRNLNRFVINGSEGGDLPEAVYEALYGSIDFYKWRSGAQKKIILIGDAEPHPTPRGSKKYTKELVSKMSKSKGIVIDTIIVPDNKSDRGRW